MMHHEHYFGAKLPGFIHGAVRASDFLSVCPFLKLLGSSLLLLQL